MDGGLIDIANLATHVYLSIFQFFDLRSVFHAENVARQTQFSSLRHLNYNVFLCKSLRKNHFPVILYQKE